MHNSLRNSQLFYYCRRLQSDDIGYTEGFDLFKEPVSRRANVKPVSREMQLVNAGEVTQEYLTLRISNNAAPYNEGDRIYFRVQPPAVHDIECKTADYVVRSVQKGLDTTEITLAKLIQT